MVCVIYVQVADRYSKRTFSFARDEVVIGSASDADLVLDKPGVAGRHIRVALQGRALVINDLRRANRPPRAVEPTDIVRIAGVDLQVSLNELTPEDVSDGIERQLLDEIRQRPDDPVPRTVYADWLEQHGHAARAEFLRQQLAVGNAKDASDPDFVLAAAQLAALAPEVGDGWRARVAMSFIEHCPKAPPRSPWDNSPPPLGLELVCPMRWDKLTPTDREGVRSCSGCTREVTYCTTIEQARTIAQEGGCIAVDIANERKPFDLEPPRMVGRPSPPLSRYGHRSKQD